MLSPRSMCGARSTNVNITEHVLIQLPTLETMGKDFKTELSQEQRKTQEQINKQEESKLNTTLKKKSY